MVHLERQNYSTNFLTGRVKKQQIKVQLYATFLPHKTMLGYHNKWGLNAYPESLK